MAFRAAVVLLMMPSMSSKCLHFNISVIFGNRKKSLGARSGEKAGCSNIVICLVAKKFAALIQAPTFSRRHTKTHADSNRCHSERDCHRSITRQSCESLICQRQQTSAATAGTRWRVRELNCPTS